MCSFLLTTGQSCGSTLSSTSGVIEWPGFSMGNPYTSKCSWQIEASISSVVELTIEYFDLAVSESCANDSLTVYDGLESSSNVLLQPSCGLAIPWPAHPNTLLSTGRTITLVFTTNSTNSLSTFRASYKQVVPREEYFFAVDANNGIIYKQNRFGVNFEEIPISGLSRPVAVDYDPVEQKVYITDVGRPMCQMDWPLTLCHGSSIDRCRFGSDGAIINVARLDGSFRRILVNTNIDSPRDIVESQLDFELVRIKFDLYE
ncbi:putative cubilin [Apostichopus japonicus]|uniref:Putative cubilin n=1 Tax=Stichopus japonicus TaxID=307972 RepID=A0A2G8JH65_STIJA|nr:putative cubilin [Apostichopus japonicus]